MSTGRRFYLAMGLHTLLAAGTFLLGKVATTHFPVLALGLFRFTLAALVFALLARLRGYDLKALYQADRRSFLFAGFLGVLLNQVGFLWGLKLTLPSHAALLYALTPTVVLLLAWAQGLERPSLRKVLGIVLAFSGVVVLFYGRHGSVLPPHWMAGDLLVLLAVVAWAGYTVVSRPLVLRHGVERTTALSILVGSAMFLPLGLVGLRDFHPTRVPTIGWIGALYLGLVASVVMYLLWFHALRLREPSRVAIAANGQPLLTALLAWLFLAQPISLQFGMGTVLVIAGVVLTQVG